MLTTPLKLTIYLTLAFTAFSTFGYSQDFMTDAKAVRTSYTLVPEESLDGTAHEVGLDQWSIMGPIFYKQMEQWSLGAGLRYELSDIDFSNTNVFNEDQLHSIDLPIFVGYDSSESLKWMLLFNPNLSGDYEQVDSDSMYYSTLVGAKYKRSETFSWLLGVYYSTGFDDDLVVPAIGFNWSPSENSDLFVGGPFIRYSYSFSDSLDLILGGRFASNRWNTSGNYGSGEEKRDFRLRSYRLSGALQWNLAERHALFLSAGWDLGREVEIEDASENRLLKEDVKHTPTFEIGYRLRL